MAAAVSCAVSVSKVFIMIVVQGLCPVLINLLIYEEIPFNLIILPSIETYLLQWKAPFSCVPVMYSAVECNVYCDYCSVMLQTSAQCISVAFATAVYVRVALKKGMVLFARS